MYKLVLIALGRCRLSSMIGLVEEEFEMIVGDNQ